MIKSLIYVKLQVRDIPCGTKGGVMINFEKIEVAHEMVLFFTICKLSNVWHSEFICID